MNDERFYKLALTYVEGVGPVLAKHLVSYCGGSASNVFQSSKGKLSKIPGIGEKTAATLKSSQQALKKAEDELKWLEKQKDVTLTFYDEPSFPQRLRRFADCPFKIYTKGKFNPNPSKSIAIVGTRNATEYGKAVTQKLVEYLSQFEDILIVSGLAYGIDVCAHKACVDTQVSTLAIMANGIDTVYPASHQALSQKICQNGGLLTENEPGSTPDAPKFPQRNRIIAGISDAVIVVEAAYKGGALITAEIASGYGVEVFAVPGNILNATYSKGCNQLIANRCALPLVDFESIPKTLNWDGLLKTQPSPYSRDTLPEDLTDEESSIYLALMQNGQMQIDLLSMKTNLPVGRLASLLTMMEFKGLIMQIPGKRFQIR